MGLFSLVAYWFASLLAYFVVSLVLSSLLRPVADKVSSIRLGAVRIPRILATLTAIAVFVGIIYGFVSVFVPMVRDQAQNIRHVDFNNLSETAKTSVDWVEERFAEYMSPEGERFSVEEWMQKEVPVLAAQLDVKQLLGALVGFAGNFFVSLMVIGFMTFFFIHQKGLIRPFIYQLIPNKYFEIVVTSVYKVEKLLSSYLLGILIQTLSVFILLSIGLWVVGAHYFIVIALFAAVVNFIPYFGPVLGALFAVVIQLITMATSPGETFEYLDIIQVLFVFMSVQLLDNILLQPLIFSKSLKAHPLEIFVVIFVGAVAGGVVGMIAAIPLYTILRVFIVEFYKGFNEYQVFEKAVD